MTLVAGSDTSEDSMDSLENQKVAKIPSFLISEPSENLPSITRGIGRKISSEQDEAGKFTNKPEASCADFHQQAPAGEEFFLRRNSDKSSVYSDDSLSNDSFSIGNQSPSSSSNTQSSHGFDTRQMDNFERMQINQELSNSGTGNFQMFRNLNLNVEADDGRYAAAKSGDSNFNKPLEHKSGSYELELPENCSKLHTTDILELVKRTINDQIPPKMCVLKSASEDLSEKLSLEYEGGIQIELKIIDRQKAAKGLKMRRISGDHLVYNKLCQQLISCMTVS